MQLSSRILTPEQCQKLIENLDECLAMFEGKQGLLNGHEIRAKSLLSVLRSEIIRHADRGDPESPF